MKTLSHCRHAASALVAAAMLAGCSGPQSPSVALPGASGGTNAAAGKHTFHYTGAQQSFKVPTGVTKIAVVARGAAGAGFSYKGSYGTRSYFGRGGRVYAVIPVRPGETLYVDVGGQGSATGGFNGGGSPGRSPSEGGGYGGGGASDVREGGDTLQDRILVAAGGGGQGYGFYNRSAFGGKGGGATGGNGGSAYSSGYAGGGGAGGMQRQGGSGGVGGEASGSPENGAPGNPGASGAGGNGGQGGYNPSPSGYNDGGGGGGGGGGYYGGGGGGGGSAAYASLYGSPGGGGGGGSSYIEPSAIKFHTWPGWKNATSIGLVVFSWK